MGHIPAAQVLAAIQRQTPAASAAVKMHAAHRLAESFPDGQFFLLVTAAAQHAVTVHGHADTSELREQLPGLLTDEPAVSAPGAFVQLIEFDTDRIGEWDAIVDRWAAAISAQRTVRWSILGSDRDRPGRYVAVVSFPGYTEAMANSGHPATEAFGKELQSICSSEPRLQNLDVRKAWTY